MKNYNVNAGILDNGMVVMDPDWCKMLIEEAKQSSVYKRKYYTLAAGLTIGGVYKLVKMYKKREDRKSEEDNNY